MIRKITLILFSTLGLWSLLALASSSLLQAKSNDLKHAPIGRLIDIGGYKLHAIDSSFTSNFVKTTSDQKVSADKRGQDGPTVVIDPGMGCDAQSWNLVYPEIAKFTRVIVVDRAGYGNSDISPLERTSKNIVHELHTMLHNANIAGPYILVGHSFGGVNVRLFANIYPHEVAGVVLVDASHEDQYNEGPILNKSSKNEKRRLKEMQKTSEGRVVAAESLQFKSNLKYLKEHDKGLGNTPLTVIMASKIPSVKEWGGGVTQQEINEHFTIVWPKLQKNLATKSSRGKLIVAHNSGHMIPNEQPEIIVEAVREMVDELRNK